MFQKMRLTILLYMLLIQKLPKFRAEFFSKRHGSSPSHSSVSRSFQRDRPSWKFTGNSDDRFGQKISRDAVYSTGQHRSVGFSLSNSHQLIPHRKHGT